MHILDCRKDLTRIDVAARLLDGPEHLAVDAIYSYTPVTSLEAADALAPLGLWWFEDICDPLDFETLAAVARRYPAPIGTFFTTGCGGRGRFGRNGKRRNLMQRSPLRQVQRAINGKRSPSDLLIDPPLSVRAESDQGCSHRRSRHLTLCALEMSDQCARVVVLPPPSRRVPCEVLVELH